jgi:type II secretory pathway component GspD/PulD (secretin)
MLLVSGLVAAEDTRLEVLTVHNRPAEDLVATLGPLAGPEGALTSLDNRLIVRATPGALAQIRAALEQLDVAPRTLWITVRQATAASNATRAGQVSGTVGGNAGSVNVSPDGATVTTSSSRTRVTGAFGSNSSQSSGEDVQRLQALEGRLAFIRVGQSVPVPTAIVGPGSTVAAATTWANADNGFWVLPRLAGALVTLEIAVAHDALGAAAAVQERRVDSVVSGHLGEWLHIGGIASQQSEQAAALLSGGSRAGTSDWNVDLKVEADPTP